MQGKNVKNFQQEMGKKGMEWGKKNKKKKETN